MKSTFTLVLFLAASLTSMMYAQNGNYLMTTQKVNVRTGPGTNFNPIAEIPQGTQVFVISSEYGDWSTIQYKNNNGWILTKFLTKDSRIAEAERASREAEAKRKAAQAAAAQAIAAAEKAKKAAEEAARKAIANAEAAKRAAEATAAQAIAAAESAKRAKQSAAQKALSETEATRRAMEEAARRGKQAEAELARSPNPVSTSNGGKSTAGVTPKKSKLTDNTKFIGYEKKTYKTGAKPKSSTIKDRYDYKLDNYLKLEVGKNTEAVVKLVRMGKSAKDDQTIREVFINSGTTHHMKNIPAGEYYLMIAYGKEWIEGMKDGKRHGTFKKYALYEKGEDLLDFTPIKTDKGINVPSFTLALDLVSGDTSGYLDSPQDNISADAFNKM